MTARRPRLLVAYSYTSTFVTTTLDYLESFRLFSDWDVHYLHVTENARITFDFSSYDALFHNYCARFCFDGYVSQSYIEAARAFEGIKILSVQDEYDFTDKVRQAAISIGFDVFLTCVPKQGLEYVYPKRMFPKTEFLHVLTGYVPSNLAAHASNLTPLEKRPRKISYRGRDIGGRYGRLGFEKLEIGQRMKKLCAARGFETDIATDEKSRIYGDAWFRFLGSCRATLGSESGSNVFDFDGKVAADFEQMSKKLGHIPSYRQFEPRIHHLEAKIDMGQVSPRLFEAAMMRTPLVLLEGGYSGILTPGVHYIPLKKDYSNVDDVLRQLDDLPALKTMTDRAYADLIASDRYSYRAFVNQVMTAAARRIAARPERRETHTTMLATDNSLMARIKAADFLEEMPTERPLSHNWYRVIVALRRNDAIAESWRKLLQWAKTEILSDRPSTRSLKTTRIAELETQAGKIGDQFLVALHASYGDQKIEDIDAIAQHAKKDYEALLKALVRLVLRGRSRINVTLTVLRAPWVEADVPALRKAKRLRERANSVRGAKAAFTFAKHIKRRLKGQR